MRPALLCLAAAAALTTVALPSGAAEPTAPRVRPGLTYTTAENGCSFGFLVRGSDRRDYAATAGHCALAAGSYQRWTGDAGPRVIDDQGRPVGRFVYADYRQGSSDETTTDLAFIRLDQGLSGDPQMCAWGGPTRMFTATPTVRTELHHNGGGLVLGDTIPSRTAYANALPRTHRLHAFGVVSFGDSGSGTTTAAGEAVGVNVTIEPEGGGAIGTTDPSVNTMGMQRLDLAVAVASKALGLRLTLRTAPLLTPPQPTDRC